MAETTNIAWCDSTFNPWIGCSKVSLGCEHCYAEISTPSRALGVNWGPHEARRRTSTATWKLPRRWHDAHKEFSVRHGRKQRVFCASLADVFDNQVDPAWRDDLWQLIRSTPNLDWLILTKRIGNVARMLPTEWASGYANVWLGITVVNQEEADRDIPKLLNTPAAVRWLSVEPLLGPVSLAHPQGNAGETIDWVVVGGESGATPRLMEPAWAESLRAQCRNLRIAFFFKQWGGATKEKGGCILRGIEVKEWPKPAGDMRR